ncbi:hypothetical protein BH23CHL2_BH23CHL2_00960 [soil metagenome]
MSKTVYEAVAGMPGTRYERTVATFDTLDSAMRERDRLRREINDDLYNVVAVTTTENDVALCPETE